MGYSLLCAISDASRAICPVLPCTAELYARNPHIAHHMSELLPKRHAVLSSRDLPSLVPLCPAFAFVYVPVDVTTRAQRVSRFPRLSPCTLVRFNTSLHAKLVNLQEARRKSHHPEAHSDHPVPLFTQLCKEGAKESVLRLQKSLGTLHSLTLKEHILE